MSVVDLSGQKRDISNRQLDPLEPAVAYYLAGRRGRESHILIWRIRITSALSVRFVAKGMGLSPGYVSKVTRRVTAALQKISREINLSASNRKDSNNDSDVDCDDFAQ